MRPILHFLKGHYQKITPTEISRIMFDQIPGYQLRVPIQPDNQCIPEKVITVLQTMSVRRASTQSWQRQTGMWDINLPAQVWFSLSFSTIPVTYTLGAWMFMVRFLVLHQANYPHTGLDSCSSHRSSDTSHQGYCKDWIDVLDLASGVTEPRADHGVHSCKKCFRHQV